MPWKASSVMEERLRFVARLLDGEAMTDVCRDFGISRKTGYKIFDRYKEHGLEALSDRSRRPVRYANQLPPADREPDRPAEGARSRIGAPARSASSWSGGWTATSGSRPRARSMRFSTATAWSSVAAGRATVRAARRCPRALRPTICGAPTSRASSSSATDATATR